MKTTLCILVLGLVVSGSSEAQTGSFVPINGTYNGLFYETNGYWQQSSGIITISTTYRGRYSARLQIGPNRYSFSGLFNSNGQVTRQILRRYENPLTVQFQVDPTDPDLIVGAVSDGNWTADLYADRAVFNGKTSISPDAGQYTIAVLGDFTSTNTPAGTSCGTITISKTGRISFSGTLADGTKVTQSSAVSKGGQWPLYVALYRGCGSLYGWLLFNASADEDLSGDVTWIKSQMPWTWYYPDGFAVLESAWGSHYVRPPRGTKVLDMAAATIEFNGGNMARGITNQVVLDDRNRIENLSANGLRLSFSLSNGAFTGRVMDPISWDWMSFRGVVLQRYNVGAGWFTDWSRTGEVWLQGE